MIKKIVHTLSLCMLFCAMMSQTAFARANTVKVYKDDLGFKVQVDEKDLFIKAIAWSHKPVGKNYRYEFWNQKESIIKAAITQDMQLLQKMGATAITAGPGIPQKWVTYIYKKFGIMTIIHWEMARWGMTYKGVWTATPDFEDPGVQQVLTDEITSVIEEYKDVSGVLMYAIGNYHNWGLGWSNPRIDALPTDQQFEAKADIIYGLLGKYTDLIHSQDPNHPVTMVNGEVDQIERIYEKCPNIDIYGANVNRGPVSGGIYAQFQAQMKDKPFMYFTLGGNGAWSDEAKGEDINRQAEIVKSQWSEVYTETYGKNTGSAIGAVMGWQDDWSMDPKFFMDWELDVHNKVPMEWGGIVAIAPGPETDPRPVIPRPAYYVLKTIWDIDPYAAESTQSSIQTIFESIRVELLAPLYIAQAMAADTKEATKVRIDELSVNLEMVGYGNNESVEDDKEEPFAYQTEEWMHLGVTGVANEQLQANIQLHILGNVATNRLVSENYNSAGKSYILPPSDSALSVDPAAPSRTVSDNERIRIYRASFNFSGENVDITGFYREGHNHWTDYGDFFHMYTEAFDYVTYDMWGVVSPIGVEFSGKNAFEGLKVAVGPQLSMGANPQIFALYNKEIAGIQFTPIARVDIGESDAVGVSTVEKQQKTSQYALSAKKAVSNFLITGGVMFSSPEKVGTPYVSVKEIPKHTNSTNFYAWNGYEVYNNEVKYQDALGGKLELLGDFGKLKFLAMGEYMGLLAGGGWDRLHTLTGWRLKEGGGGNKIMSTFGVTYDVGDLKIAPNFLYQQPIVGPLPALGLDTGSVWGGDSLTSGDGALYNALTPRRGDLDPFTANARKTIGGELLLTYDPTPNTFFYRYNTDDIEDAYLAADLRVTYKHQPTWTDAFTYDNGFGDKYAFGKGRKPFDAYSIESKIFMNPSKSTKTIINGYYDHKQCIGEDDRIIDAFGGNVAFAYDAWTVRGGLKFNDWGPYDWMQQFNLTFPLQTSFDLIYGLSNQLLPEFTKRSKIGLGIQYRTTDENSPLTETQYGTSDQLDYEIEIRTYVNINI